jgi:diguanylate cyclase (GGDEF)-like protein
LRHRFAPRADSEHVQALIRIAFGVVFAGYLYLTLGWRYDVHIFFIGFELVACAIFAAVVAYPSPLAWRRRFGTIVDMTGATGVMLAYGEVGAPVYGIYLWVTFGNGFRYGLASLYASQAMGIAGFATVVALTPFWREHPLLSGGLLVLLAALPLYGAVLLKALASANRSLQEQAVRDVLTGLYNRRYLIDAMEREVHRATRRKESLAVIVIDIDHFKQFNDNYGHAAGDEVLRSVAQAMAGFVRTEDILCRLGGEEFVVVQTKTSADAVVQRANKLRQRIASHEVFFEGERLGPVTLSIGAALFPDHGASAPSVLRAADRALYRAKRSGRNRVVLAEAQPEAREAARAIGTSR